MQQFVDIVLLQQLIPFLTSIIGLCILYVCLQALQLTDHPLMIFVIHGVLLLFLLKIMMQALVIFQQLLHLFIGIYTTMYPLLFTFFTALQSFLSLVSISPLFIAINSVYVLLLQRFLIPIIVTSLLLTISSYLYPAISFQRLAQLLRKSILVFLALFMLIYSSVLAVSTALLRSTSTVGTTIRKLFEQNIPLVGSVFTEILGLVKQFQFVASSGVGLTALIISALALFTPVLSLFLYSVALSVSSAIVEPFMHATYAQLIEEFSKTLFMLTALTFILMSQLFVTLVILYVGVNFQWS